MTDAPSREYITLRLERSAYDDLCRVRLAFANDVDDGVEYVPDPGGPFPSLSWVVGYLSSRELRIRDSAAPCGRSNRRPGKGRKGRVPRDDA